MILGRVIERDFPWTGPVTHHHNYDRFRAQVVLCQDRSYHRLLHRRTRAYRASGHADWRRCLHCEEHDDPGELTITQDDQAHHPHCITTYIRLFTKSASAPRLPSASRREAKIIEKYEALWKKNPPRTKKWGWKAKVNHQEEEAT